MAEQKKPETKAERTEEQVKNSLYSKATTTLRERHREEFQTILAAAYKEAGLEYKRRLSPEEKARAEIERLLAEHPTLGLKVVEEPQTGLPTGE